jgi:hypothetical protein
MAPLLVLGACAPAAEVEPAQVEPGPRSQPGTTMGIYAPEQHPLYDGNFNVRGGGIYQVGTLTDESPWDHIGDDGSNVRRVGGSVVFEVNEIENLKKTFSNI